MNEKEFIESLKKISVNLTEEQLLQFSLYCDFLLEYNGHTNLTAIRNREDVYLKHFYDSLMLLEFKKLNNEKVLDIGSGPGFPGVPLKIVNPKIDLTVLDSNGKKTKFLELLKDKLNIEYTVINERAEEYVKTSRESFDLVLSRAVTSMPVLAELSIPFVKIGGYFIPYKGFLDETLECGKYALETLGTKVENVIMKKLPKENSTRTFVVAYKERKTNIIYPRLFDKINKKPLQKITK